MKTKIDKFTRWMAVSSTANYIADMQKYSDSVLNIEKIVMSMLLGSKGVSDLDWITQRQINGLKRDVIKHLNAIEERDLISFKLGNLKQVQKINWSLIEK